MYSVVANYVCMSNSQLCYSPSTYLQISVFMIAEVLMIATYLVH